MAKNQQRNPDANSGGSAKARNQPSARTTAIIKAAKCADIAEKGIRNGKELSRFFLTALADLAAKRIESRDLQAFSAGAGKVLRVFELEQRHGSKRLVFG